MDKKIEVLRGDLAYEDNSSIKGGDFLVFTPQECRSRLLPVS